MLKFTKLCTFNEISRRKKGKTHVKNYCDLPWLDARACLPCLSHVNWILKFHWTSMFCGLCKTRHNYAINNRRVSIHRTILRSLRNCTIQFVIPFWALSKPIKDSYNRGRLLYFLSAIYFQSLAAIHCGNLLWPPHKMIRYKFMIVLRILWVETRSIFVFRFTQNKTKQKPETVIWWRSNKKQQNKQQIKKRANRLQGAHQHW